MRPTYHKPRNAGVVHTGIGPLFRAATVPCLLKTRARCYVHCRHLPRDLCYGQTGPQTSFLSAPLNRAAGIPDPLCKRQNCRAGSRVCARGDEKSMLVGTSTKV